MQVSSQLFLILQRFACQRHLNTPALLSRLIFLPFPFLAIYYLLVINLMHVHLKFFNGKERQLCGETVMMFTLHTRFRFFLAHLLVHYING